VMDDAMMRRIPVRGDDEPEAESAPEDDPQAEAAGEPQAEAAPAEDAPRTVQELQAEVERLREELAAEHDRHLRAVAELQNFRKRITREQQERAHYAGQDVLEQILPVMDNLKLVLEHEAEAGDDEFARGVRLVVEQFFRVLEQMGVTVIDCEGEAFDPGMHEAVARVPTGEVPEGTVVAVDTPGYCLHDRCIRPARVVVAGAPEQAESPS